MLVNCVYSLITVVTLNCTWFLLDANTVTISLNVSGAQRVDWFKNITKKLCSDGHSFQGDVFICNKTTLTTQLKVGSNVSFNFHATHGGTVHNGVFNVSVYESTAITQPPPLSSLLSPLHHQAVEYPSTKRLYYLLPLAFVIPAWLVVLFIHYADFSK
nr:ORF4a [Bat coronavirus]